MTVAKKWKQMENMRENESWGVGRVREENRSKDLLKQMQINDK